jgi:hypothetical protein
LEQIYQSYKDRVQFFIIYTTEAHPWRDPFAMGPGANSLFNRRCKNAELCSAAFGLTIPVLVDGPDDAVTSVYGGFPDRVVIIDRTGTVAYISETTTELRMDEVAWWLGLQINTSPRLF